MYKYIVILILFAALDVIAQRANSCEKNWLTSVYFNTDKPFETKLLDIYDLTLLGKYKEARQEINNIKHGLTSNSKLAAVLCYEATICYNESRYEKAIELSDSTITLLKTEPANRYAIKALNTKAKALGALNDYQKAEHILDSTIRIANMHGDKYGLAASYYLLGSFYSDKGDYDKSNQLNEKSIALRMEMDDRNGLAACYSFMGLNFAHMSNYVKGIEYIQKSISIREKTGDKRGLANSYLNLYKIYIEIGEAYKAMESEEKSLSICRDIGDLQCVSGRLTNIGQIYQNKGEYAKALEYHHLALQISKQINIKNRVALVHENIARVYKHTGNYKDAICHLDTSMAIRRDISDAEGLVSAKLLMAEILYKKQEYAAATKDANEALTEAQHLKLPYLIKESHELMSALYQKLHQADKALFHYQKFIALRDSIYNIDKTKEIVRKELEFDFKRRQELERIKQAERERDTLSENRRQRTIIIFSTVGILVLSFLLLFAVWMYRQRTRSEKALEWANNSLSLTNKELHEKNEIIEIQHNTIQAKNTEITDSIRYAHKIQSAMMPLRDEFAGYFKESFVLFEPRDIISGDFFWITTKNDKIIYATGDCTGHGVPGGFMSMLGVSLLNEIVNEHDLTEPALIMSRLRKKVITALKQKGLEGEQQDGMDMTICVIDKAEKKLHYAAANHFFYVIRKAGTNFDVVECRGEKQPVGIFGHDLKPFRQYEVSLQENDTIYTFTDGLADQFGGPKGKKFKYKQLKELLVSIQDQPMAEQEKLVYKTFKGWKGKLDQVDDVCLIGVKI